MGAHTPNNTVASPVLRASETRYFCCFNVKVLSPCSSTWHTRLWTSEQRGNKKSERERGSYRLVPPRSSARKVLSTFGVRTRQEIEGMVRYPVSVPSGTPVTKVGLERVRTSRSID